MNETVLKEETYRSQPLVNMPDDMIRVTFQIPIWQYREIKQKFINLLHKERIKHVHKTN